MLVLAHPLRTTETLKNNFVVQLKMNKQCPKCDKIFSRTNDVTKHLKKIIPCNFQCRTCNEILENLSEYNKHKKLHVPKFQEKIPKIPKKRTDIVVAPKDNRKPIPIQDFDLSILTELGLTLDDVDIEYRMAEKEDQTEARFLNGDGDYQVDRITKIERRETLILRLKNAKNTFTNEMLYGAMCSMVPTHIDMPQLTRIATNMIYDVLHHDDPRLHNICLSDISRGTVRVLSRVAETDKTYWAAHPNTIAAKVINVHARNLFSFMLEAGMQSLVSAIWKNNQCLALNGEVGWSVILYEENDQLLARKIHSSELVYSPTKDVARLMELVQTRKDEVIGLLRNLIIDNGDLKTCLEECRRFCYTTMQQTMNNV